MIFKRFYSPQSDGDMCTLHADRTLINRRNVKTDPKAAYAADRDFLILEVKARIVACAMEVIGFESLSGPPLQFPIREDLQSQSKSEQLKYLHAMSSKIVDTFITPEDDAAPVISQVLTPQDQHTVVHNQCLDANSRFKCRFAGCNRSFKYDGKSKRSHELTHQSNMEIQPAVPEPSGERPGPVNATKPTDDVYNYNCALLVEAMLFLNFLDAVKEGDGKRLMRQYKYLMLYCKADKSHSTKYALECLYQMFLVNSLLSPRDAHRYIWNRSVNNRGGLGNNIPLDLEVEHSNNFVKQAVKNLGPNVTQKSVSRICKAEKSIRAITDNLKTSIAIRYKSRRHTHRNTDKDMATVVDGLVKGKAFQKQEGRCYTHFKGFEKSPLYNLDKSNLFKWINNHVENIHSGIKAR